ncbi:hypothetical protein PHYPSEUDO_008514 [Phytophthora pseudosyringae]|uniref:PDZ domain-containing protein n=1 Tax=Phytophthora pseudosyringae TaxID=221518 RepID=A0A8T1VJ95_9STRA|nr:hypothetical protein PHYPSEUDO_008514 [Phytophthora pseudosyringae]
MESDAPSSAAKPKTGMDFLRSAMDWRSSSRADTSGQRPSADDGDCGATKQQDAELPVEVEAEPEAAAGKKQFEVTYQCLPDVEEQVEAAEEEEEAAGRMTGRRPMQFLDVLLQTDAHGVGLSVGLETVEDGGGQVLVVQSFRRLGPRDVGPAEACGKIRVGDILHAVDGEEVCSLQQLHGQLAGRRGRRRKFVLLRLLRPVAARGDSEASATSLFAPRRRPVDAVETKWTEVDAILRTNPQIATLVRQLATTNAILQEQLLASRLKQEEQSIQLDQLHALYARTQAEGLPLFSLSKSIRPFSRKASFAQGGDSCEKPIPTKIQTEVMEAVNAEYARLRQEFQLQHLLDKRELEKKYAEKAQKLEEATAKKVDMLEEGFQEALRHYTDTHDCHCRSLRTPSALNLTNGVSRQQWEDSDENFKNFREQTTLDLTPEMEDASCAKLEEIVVLLMEYEKDKHVRTANLKTASYVK